MSWEEIYFFACGAVMSMTVMTLCIAVIMPGTNQWNKRFFVMLLAVFMLCMLCFFVDLMVYDDPSMAQAEKIVAYFEYLLMSITMPIFTAYLLRTCGEDWRKSLLFRTVLALWSMFF